MRQLTTKQIQNNWKKLIQLIDDTFVDTEDNERHTKLREMYDYFEDRMVIAPASGKEHYHNAFVGGYVEHVLHVIDCAIKLKKVWEECNANINFTDEELIFAAMHHDLGKVGDMENDYYIPNESDWHRKNQGKIFTHNPKLQYMTVTDRAIFLLNQFGITMSEKEYIGLRLTDGLYEEANKSYYISYDPDWSLKSNIAYILHQADSMATHIEYDMWKHSLEEKKAEVVQRVENIKNAANNPTQERTKDLFNELFGDKK